jgi:hypothetical protein
MSATSYGTAGGQSATTLDRARHDLLYALVDAWWAVPAERRQDFEVRRDGGAPERFAHPGLPGRGLAPDWRHLRELATDGYLVVVPAASGSTWVRLRELAFARFDAVHQPPDPAAAKRRVGFPAPV